jgi:molybdopterin-guanine dinucleotide biosynthesis protein A
VVLQAPRAEGLSAAITGFVLAGGRSARMGRDKALLSWGDATLLDHAIARLRQVTDDVRVLCGPEPRYADRSLPLVVDLPGPASALVGLLSALAAAPDRTCLLLAVDLPNVTPALLHALTVGGGDAVVPVGPSGPEPLCAAYRGACAEPLRAAIACGDLKMTSFWRDVQVRTIEGEALARLGNPLKLFVNVNLPEEYERATRGG